MDINNGVIINFGIIETTQGTINYAISFTNLNYKCVSGYMDTDNTEAINVRNISFWNRTLTSASVRNSGTNTFKRAYIIIGS